MFSSCAAIKLYFVQKIILRFYVFTETAHRGAIFSVHLSKFKVFTKKNQRVP